MIASAHLDGDPSPALATLDQIRQRLAPEQLHGEKQTPVPLPELDDLDDVRVGKLGHHLAFTLEPLHDLLDVGELGMKQLDRDWLPRGELRGAIHAAHPPLTDNLDEAVAVAKSTADERRVIHCGLICWIGR